MTPAEADEFQNWKHLRGDVAWQLIERYADEWETVQVMMEAWLRARSNEAIRAAVAAERGLQAMHDDKQYLLGMRAAAKYVIGDCEILTPPCRTIVEFDYAGLMKAIDSRQAQIDAAIREGEK